MIKSEIINAIREEYSDLLVKNYKYQMGDDDYQLSTNEYTLVKAVQAILNDLNNRNQT
jgi:hypothetical protein